MRIVSVNVGRRERLEGRSFEGETGICKRPVAGPVVIGELGLEGDAIVHTEHHGGPDQAVYLYRVEDYQWWGQQLGVDVDPGSFGDNLTLGGLPTPDLPVGSRLLFAQVVLEVTAPRIPCNILATRMGDPGFAKRFIAAERPGIYCRVIERGEVRADEAFRLDGHHDATVSTLEMFRAAYRRNDADELRRFLAAPIDARSREQYARKLARLAS